MDTELDALFDRLNADLFEGRLPKYRVRRCAPRTGERGFIEEEARTIWICTSPDPRRRCSMKCVTSERLGTADLPSSIATPGPTR